MLGAHIFKLVFEVNASLNQLLAYLNQVIEI